MIEIVKLHPDEWSEYRAIRLEALLNEPQAFCSTYADNLIRSEEQWRDRLVSAAHGQGNRLLFAREDNRLIGIVGAFVQDDPAVADIVSVYVTPEARGRGVARKMLSKILSLLGLEQQIIKARLTVNTDQQIALSLYGSLGFEVVSEEEAVMGDGILHREYVMEKRLT